MNDADIKADFQPGSGRPRLFDSLRVRHYSRRLACWFAAGATLATVAASAQARGYCFAKDAGAAMR